MVPQKLRPQLLEELHTRHLGVVKMKAQPAVTYGGQVATVILNNVRICHSRHLCTRGSGHLHTGREYTLGICTYVIVVDAHSKWSEVIMTKFTTYMKTVEILKTIFVRSGLPEQLVSDNRPKFVSEEIKEFGSKRNSSYN